MPSTATGIRGLPDTVRRPPVVRGIEHLASEHLVERFQVRPQQPRRVQRRDEIPHGGMEAAKRRRGHALADIERPRRSGGEHRPVRRADSRRIPRPRTTRQTPACRCRTALVPRTRRFPAERCVARHDGPARRLPRGCRGGSAAHRTPPRHRVRAADPKHRRPGSWRTDGPPAGPDRPTLRKARSGQCMRSHCESLRRGAPSPAETRTRARARSREADRSGCRLSTQATIARTPPPVRGPGYACPSRRGMTRKLTGACQARRSPPAPSR